MTARETALRVVRAIGDLARAPGSQLGPRMPEWCTRAEAMLVDTKGPDDAHASTQRLHFAVWEKIGSSLPDEEDWTRSRVWELTVGAADLTFASYEHLATMVQAGYDDQQSWTITDTETDEQARARDAWEETAMNALPKPATSVSFALRGPPGDR